MVSLKAAKFFLTFIPLLPYLTPVSASTNETSTSDSFLNFGPRLLSGLFHHKRSPGLGGNHASVFETDSKIAQSTGLFLDIYGLDSYDGICGKLKNSPINRQLWKDGYDIRSDTDAIWPEGKSNKYHIIIEEIAGAMQFNGWQKERAITVNGRIPGTPIVACWGDIVEVQVENQLPHNGTTIHWHGLRQYLNNEADGVNGVTQCPIAPGETYTYKFRVEQHGTSWYHSHYTLQYPDGLFGPLIFYGPTTKNWDRDLGYLLLSDNNYEPTFKIFSTEAAGSQVWMDQSFASASGQYYSTSGGLGSQHNRDRDNQHVRYHVEKGKSYLMWVINISSTAQWEFSIDNHMFWVVSADFVPVKPFQVSRLQIAIGQRYGIVIDARPMFDPAQKGNNKSWIRMKPTKGCGKVKHVQERIGFLTYDGPESKMLPTSHSVYRDVMPYCSDIDPRLLQPIVPWRVPNPLHYSKLHFEDKEGGHAGIPNLAVATGPKAGHGVFGGNAIRWSLGPEPFWAGKGRLPTNQAMAALPTFQLLENQFRFSGINGEGEEFTFLILTANISDHFHTGIPTSHPLHLHGHDFAIVAQSRERYEGITTLQRILRDSVAFHNIARRDVASVPNGGFLMIALKNNNVGSWVLHCHIAFHASAGLAIEIIESQHLVAGPVEDGIQVLSFPGQEKDTCEAFLRWLSVTEDFEQIDSGV